MSTPQYQNGSYKEDQGVAHHDTSDTTSNNEPVRPIPTNMTQEEHDVATAAARFGYGPLARADYGPLAKVNTNEASLPAFGGEFQPGLYRSVRQRKFANPAPLGLCAFALTTFVLSAVNMQTRKLTQPNIVVGLALAYGGFVQLCAGMW